jgi:hypothetical protein
MPDAPPGQIPEPGPWMLLIIPVIILSVIGSLTMTLLALGRPNDAGQAFSIAVRRFPVVLAAALLMGLAVALLALPIAVVIVLLAGTEAAALALATLAIGIAFMAVWVRLILLNPVGAVEPLGPVAILRRSWVLTQGHFWKLFGFILVVVIVYLVVTLAVSGVIGSLIVLAAGQPQHGNLSRVLLLLLSGVLNAALGVFLAVVIARIYAQLAGEPTSGS